MAARDPALLVAQHDVAAVAARRREQRQRLAVDPFDQPAAAIARADSPIVQTVGDGDRRFMDDGAGRRGEDDLALPPPGRDSFDLVDESEVGLGRRGGMVGLVGAEEGPGRRRSRREGDGSRLKSGTAGLVLQAH